MKNKQIYKDHSVQTILDFPANAVFGLVHEGLKLVYLTHANEMVVGLNKILGQLKQNKDIEPILTEFTVKVFDVDPYPKNRELTIGKLMDQYSDDGYNVLNSRKPLKFKGARIAKKDCLYFVYLINMRKTKYIIAVFDSAQKAKDFYIEHYRNKPIDKIIYAENKLTRDYLNHRIPKIFP